MANARKQSTTRKSTSKRAGSKSKESGGPRYRAPALEKGLDVLEILGARGEPLTMAQISSELERSMGELFRVIQVLEFRDFVRSAESGNGYVLTDRLLALGMKRVPGKDLIDTAVPYMRAFARETKQSCHLVISSGDHMVVVKRAEAAGDVGFSVRVGFRRPLIGSASGLVLFAFQPDPVREEWKARLSGAVEARVWEDFEKKARKARRDGCVNIPSDRTRGVTDLSAPIMHLGMVVAALTCPHVDTYQALGPDETMAQVRSTAQEITQALAGALE